MYQVYALMVGERDRPSAQFAPGLVDSPTIRLYYYLWVLRGEDGTVIAVDTGTLAEDARPKNLERHNEPQQALARLGIDAAKVPSVIITHLHWDHCSAVRRFSGATIYVQRQEVEFWTGPTLRFRQIQESASRPWEIVEMAYQGRVRYLEGDAEPFPGVRVLHLGGHTPGMQAVAVETAKGRLVLCSDAADFYLNLDNDVMSAALNLPAALMGFDRMREAASSLELLVPGHDPLVMQRFPQVAEGVVQLA